MTVYTFLAPLAPCYGAHYTLSATQMGRRTARFVQHRLAALRIHHLPSTFPTVGFTAEVFVYDKPVTRAVTRLRAMTTVLTQVGVTAIPCRSAVRIAQRGTDPHITGRCCARTAHRKLNRVTDEIRKTVDLGRQRKTQVAVLWIESCRECLETHISYRHSGYPIEAFICRCEREQVPGFAQTETRIRPVAPDPDGRITGRDGRVVEQTPIADGLPGRTAMERGDRDQEQEWMDAARNAPPNV